MISTFYPPHHFGGDAIFVYRLAHALAERGHEVDVLHNQDAFDALSPQAPAEGYHDHPRVRRMPLRSRLGPLHLLAVQQTGRAGRYGRALESAFERGRYDVVHFHNVSLMGAPEILGWSSRTDAVSLYTLHEHWLVCPMHVLWRFDREPCEKRTCLRCQLAGRRPPQLWRYGASRDRAAAAVSAFLAPSEFTRDKHLALGFPVEPRLLPHFVPEPPAARVMVPPARPYFLVAARLERLKGIDTVINAFLRFPEADLVIVGDGSDRARLIRLSAGARNIRFEGRLAPDSLAEFYRQAVAVLCPSLCYEVFGLTAVEAFACGTPAIVRDRGALPELIRASQAGFSYLDEGELMTAMRRLLDEVGLRGELSRRARVAYEQHWTVDRHIDRYLGLIAELHAEPRRPSE